MNDKTHNIKYYSVDENLPKIDGYTNEGNDGAKGMGSIAAGFNTHADGIASTVAGSYSGVINTGDVKFRGYDLRGATALSYGTFNVNQSTAQPEGTAQPEVFSGVANSIVGQANATTDSNAAIIYGAGNTVTNSYRSIDTSKFDLGKVEQDIAKKNAAAVAKDLQEAVPTSGGQVMVMGGGNSVDKAYMTQVTGVGNKVSGNDSTYAEGTSTQYNFVDGFQNELTNGKHDYIIGSKNKVSGDSVDTNQSNIIFGDNHKLTNRQNNVIIGSSDTADDETTASDIVAIGHNAKVSAEGGVAIGSGSVVAASTEKVSGYDPTTKTQSTDKTSHVWNATTGAVSIGTADGTVTRQLNGVAAGTNDTDAVNVAQLKSLQSGLTEDLTGKGLKFKGDDSKEIAKKLNNTMEIIGGADSKTLTEGNIGVNSTDKGQLKVQLAKDLKGITSISNQTTKEDSSGKDVTTGAKITLSGSDGTVNVNGGKVTGLAAGTGDTDAVTVKQMNDKIDTKISDVTYTAGNGIDLSNKQISAKAGTGITVDGNGINVNLGKHLTTDETSGAIDVQDTGAVEENNADLVTGGTVYNALHGGLTDITVGKDGQNGQAGSIGLVGPKGQDGKDGLTTTIIKTETGAAGVNGTDGKDGITRIVYGDKDNPTDKHTVATLEDGLKFKGDVGDEIAKTLNSTMDIVGGVTDSKKLTDNNIGVTNADGKLKIQLAKELNGITSIGNQTTTKDSSGKDVTTGAKITLSGSDGTVNINGGKITNMGNGVEKDSNGKYAVTDDNKGNAANIGDVQNIVKDAVGDASDKAKEELNKKANVDASNIGTNLKKVDGTTASAEEITKNKEAWASAIGTNEVAKGNKQLVTSDAVATALETKADKSYVDDQLKTKADKSYVDNKLNTKADADKVYTKDQTYSKTEVDNKRTALMARQGKTLKTSVIKASR